MKEKSSSNARNSINKMKTISGSTNANESQSKVVDKYHDSPISRFNITSIRVSQEGNISKYNSDKKHDLSLIKENEETHKVVPRSVKNKLKIKTRQKPFQGNNSQ